MGILNSGPLYICCNNLATSCLDYTGSPTAKKEYLKEAGGFNVCEIHFAYIKTMLETDGCSKLTQTKPHWHK